jgi:copper homeostasis protein (lipoprotein)
MASLFQLSRTVFCRPSAVSWVFIMVALAACGAPDPRPAAAFALDRATTFSGTLPCADCPGIRWQLDLWPEGRFHLRREYVDRDAFANQLGRWRVDLRGARLILEGSEKTRGNAPVSLAISDADTLRLLDTRGQVIESTLPYELRRQANFEPAVFAATFSGEFRYLADAAGVQECATGHRYPVLMEGAYLAVERAYLNAVQTSGEPLFLTFDGELLNRQAMEGEGPPQSLRINRFLGFEPGRSCAMVAAAADR